MSGDDQSRITIKPVISYPREAQPGKSYLMKIDLQMLTPYNNWPYKEEEYPVWLILKTLPLFSYKPIGGGDSAVVLHRFGGTYGPAMFLLTAALQEMSGEIEITLVNQWGVPIDQVTLTSTVTSAVLSDVMSGRRIAAKESTVIDNAQEQPSVGDILVDLVFDRRAQLLGQPGFHALIAGVSAYQNLPKQNEPQTTEGFGLRQLSLSALTAYKIYRWLLDHQKNFPVPLATCRLLLSPSPDEVAIEPSLNSLVGPCTLNNFLRAAYEWRNDASSHQSNMTFFYFVGHGAQRTMDDAVLLLEDFGDMLGSPLRNAVDTNNIFRGMAKSNTYPNIAQTQLYFIDASRDFLRAFRNFETEDTTSVFRVQLSGEDKRTAPIFYAAAPSTNAFSIEGEQTLFSKALLDCLNGDAGELREVNGEERWRVSVRSLGVALQTKIDDLNKTLGAEQDLILGGFASDAPILFLDSTPLVDLVLEVDPPEAISYTKIELSDDLDKLVELPMPLSPHPYQIKLPAGTYRIRAVIDPPNPRFANTSTEVRPLMPPGARWKVKVLPYEDEHKDKEGRGDYMYDVYISYRHMEPTYSWVLEYLSPLLEQWLPEFMPVEYDVKIFIDSQIETGAEWPATIRQALQRSRCMLAVLSPQYFRSKWSQAEFQTMLRREQLLGLRTEKNPSGLIYPVVFAGAENLPSEVRAIQYQDLSKWTSLNPNFKNSAQFVDFVEQIKILCQQLAKMIQSAPAWQEDFPVVIPDISPNTTFESPRL